MSQALLLTLAHIASGLKIASSLTTIEYTPELVASQDYYNGTTPVSIVNGGVANLFSDSSIDLAGNAETQALVQFATHKDLRIIYTVAEVYYRIVANKNSGISTIADLKGKRIGTIPSTSAAYFVQKYLSSVGIAASQYTVVSGGVCMTAPCGAGTFPYMLQNNQVDAVGMWEPTVELAVEALGTNAVVFQNESVYREVFNLHSTTEKLADPTIRNNTVAFIRALNQAEAVFTNNPSSIYARVASAVGISVSVLEAVWGIHKFRGSLASDLLSVLVAEDQWVAQLQGRVAMSSSDLQTLIDPSVLADALNT